MMQETHIVENKTIWKDKWLEWICGFANAQGGILNVGTADDGTPVGLADIKSLLEKFPNKIINKLGIVSDVNKRTLNGIDYIEILHKSAFLMSLAFICHLGIEVFWALDTNRWRIKLANEEYQVYKAIILMILNAVVLSLTGPNGSIYPIIIVPIILWGMMIMIRRFRRWFKS